MKTQNSNQTAFRHPGSDDEQIIIECYGSPPADAAADKTPEQHGILSGSAADDHCLAHTNSTEDLAKMSSDPEPDPARCNLREQSGGTDRAAAADAAADKTRRPRPLERERRR